MHSYPSRPLVTQSSSFDYLRKRGLRRPLMASVIAGQPTLSVRRLPSNKVYRHHYERLLTAFPPCKRPRRSHTTKALQRLCTVLETQSRVFDAFPVHHEKLIPKLISLAQQSADWLRLPETWESSIRDSAKQQLGSLLEHLFVKFPPPTAFKSIFEKRDFLTGLEYQWYLHLGQGKNLRFAENLPVDLSKKEAHFVLQAPMACDIHTALFWGKMKVAGLSNRMLNAFLQTYPVRTMLERSRKHRHHFNEMDWMLALGRLFVRTPDAETRQIGPLVDYLYRRAFIGLNPLRRDLKNLTLATLWRRMEEWHDTLHRCWWQPRSPYQSHHFSWKADHFVRPYHVTNSQFTYDRICCWELIELCSSTELAREGSQMEHCVASYAYQCADGRSSIWSLRCTTLTSHRIEATIEIQKGPHNRRLLVQARVKNNREPREEAVNVIMAWARENRIENRYFD